MKQSISAGWIVAFFVIGILLGLLALQLLEARDPLAWLFPARETTTPASSPAVAARRNEPPSPAVASAPPTRRETSPVPPPAAEITPPLPERIAEPLVCDRRAAARVREKAREVAEIFSEGERLTVKLRDEWSYYSDGVRRSFVGQFTDSDTCLNGRPRPIEFYYQGDLFATALPEQGLLFK